LEHDEAVNGAAFSPDGRFVVTACQDQTARLWDVATGKPLGKPLRHAELVKSAAFSPDGRHVVTACKDGTAQIWDVNYSRVIAATDAQDRQMLASVLEAISETRIDPETDTAVRAPDDPHVLRGRVASRAGALRAYHDVLAWHFSDPTSRPVWPGSSHTVPRFVATLLAMDQRWAWQAAYELNPTDPVALLAIAGDEKDPARQHFQRQSALKRLPDDVAAYASAISILRKQKEEVLSTILLERARAKFPETRELQGQR
ncbi:MAG: hypothetical protein HZA91_03760, partial [Verrucomicrobia bacterium]|nr:hypothetical protein [Verrucomicrobiota bacterium]